RRLRRPLQHRLTAEEIACRKAANAVSRIQIRIGRDHIRLRRRALKNRSREHDNLTACLQALGLLLLCGELLVPLQLQLLGLLELLQLQLLVKGLLRRWRLDLCRQAETRIPAKGGTAVPEGGGPVMGAVPNPG